MSWSNRKKGRHLKKALAAGLLTAVLLTLPGCARYDPGGGIQVDQYAIEQHDTEPDDSYSVTFDLRAAKTGQYRADTVAISLQDGKTLEYFAGDWLFDVGPAEPEEALADPWSSPAASSNGSKFVYHYQPA